MKIFFNTAALLSLFATIVLPSAYAMEAQPGKTRAKSETSSPERSITYPAISRSQLSTFKQQIRKIDANCAELLITIIPHRMKVDNTSIRLKRNAEMSELFSTWAQQKQWYTRKIPAGMMISYAYKLKIEALDKNGVSLGELPRDYAMKLSPDQFSTISNSIMSLKCFPEVK